MMRRRRRARERDGETGRVRGVSVCRCMLGRARQQAIIRLQRLAGLPLQATAVRSSTLMSSVAGLPAEVDPRTGKAARLPLLQREDCTAEQAEIFDRVTSSASPRSRTTRASVAVFVASGPS